MAGVTARQRGKKWEYRFDLAKVSGERKQMTKGGFVTKAEAIRAGTQALAEYNSCGVTFVPSEISFADYLDYWMENYCASEVSESTCNGYAKRIKNDIKPALGNYKLNALTTEVIQNFLNTLFHNGISRNSVVCTKGILTGSLKYAVTTAKFIRFNPATDTHIPPNRVVPNVAPKKIKRVYIRNENADIIFTRFPYGTSCHIPLLTGYRCGARLGEAFAVVLEDIDFKKQTLFIQRQVQYTKENQLALIAPKYGSYRKISVDSHMMAVWEKAKADREKNHANYGEQYQRYYVMGDSLNNPHKHGILLDIYQPGCTEVFFINVREDGSFISPRCEMHCSRIIHKQLGFPEFNFHSLRHTHATILAEKGARPKDVQNRLGHKNIQVTMEIYTHLTKEMEDISIGILNDIPIPGNLG